MASCAPAERQVVSVPILENLSTLSIRTDLEAALGSVERAREALDADPVAAGVALDEVRHALDGVLTFTLPVMEAGGRAYDAYRLYSLDRAEDCMNELEKIEEILIEVARLGGDHLAAEVREPLELLEDARLAAGSAAPDTLDRLKALAERLDRMVIKAGLILQES